ncbi:MAG: ABC transporter permease [Phycisphaeraceae bacterium]|nr:ABC transporter permease [Phycisphaeraceae bacterium]
MNPILAMAKKDLTYLVRDRTGFFFVFAFPVIFAVFFGLIFSGMGGESSGIKVVVVDLDNSEGSKAFAEQLRGSESLRVIPFAEDPDNDLSLTERAARAVRNGTVAAYIQLEPGFGESQASMFQGESATITIGADPSRSAESGMLEGIVAEKAYSEMSRMFSDPDLMRDQSRKALESVRANASPAVRMVMVPFLSSLDQFADGLESLESEGDDSGGGGGGFNPVTINHADVLKDSEHEFSAFELSFPQGLVWGLMSAAFTFGLSFVIERTRGTLLRLRIAPVPTGAILAGKSLACFTLLVALSSAMLAFGAVAFDVRPDSVAHLAMAIVAIGCCWVGVMMLIAVSGKTEAAVGGIGWAILMLMAMIGGGMIPRPFMPSWMETVGVISPVRWSLQALEGALWRGYSTTEMLTPCAVLAGIGLLGFLCGARLFDWSAAE